MIPEKIHAIFKFIDYLDMNKAEYIEKYIPLCSELRNLDQQRSELNPNKNYIDKQKYDKIQSQITEKFQPIKQNIYIPVLNKLKELGIWAGDDVLTSIWNGNISAISDFKKGFTLDDVSQVVSYKQKYLAFRKETNSNFLCLQFIFSNLDEILRELFDFFKDTNENEFDSFETKTIEAKNMQEAVTGLIKNRGENVKISIPMEALSDRQVERQLETNNINLIKEIVMGDKIQSGDISNNKGAVSIGKGNKTQTNADDVLSKKTFNWQKWGIIVGIVLAIIAIIVTIIVS